MAVGSPAVHSLPADYYAGTSVLASGKWVKVKVTESGMQQITYETLRSLGFDDPGKVAVFGYSGIDLQEMSFSTSLPDDLPAVPVTHAAGKLLFYADAAGMQSPVKYDSSASVTRYAQKLYRNLFNDHAVFFLTDSREPLAVGTVDAEADEGIAPLERSQGFALIDYKEHQPGKTGAFLFSAADMAANPQQTINIFMPGFEPDGDGPNIETGVGMLGGSPKIGWCLPGETPGIQTVTGYGSPADYKIYFYGRQSFRYPAAVKCEGDIYPFTMDASRSYDLRGGWIDYIAAIYPRRNDMTALAQSLFGFPKLEAGGRVSFTGAPATLRVWEVTRNATPREFAVTAGEDGSAWFVSDRARAITPTTDIPRFVAFDPEATLCEPEIVGDVPNQNLHAMATPDMIVVASDNCYSQALRLTDIHRRHTGHEVAVVRARDVYNEFSSGLAHPQGIRRFVKMLYDRDPSKLRAVMVFAAAFTDITGITYSDTRENFDKTFIPMLESQDFSNAGIVPRSYATDALLGMLDDDFNFASGTSSGDLYRGSMTIPVGRVPASNYGEAMAYVDKLERYFADPDAGPSYNRAVILTDERNENVLLDQGEIIRGIIGEHSPSTTVHAYHFALYDYHENMDRVKEHLIGTLQRGAGLWAFLGHSAGPQISGFWDAACDRATPVKYPPFSIFGSCATLGMDNTGANTIQVNMTLNPIGGMLGGIGSIRSVYLDYNDDVCNHLVRSFYTSQPGDTYGDVYLRGRNSFSGSNLGNNTNAMATLLNYNLAGDPLIPVGAPSRRALVTEINGNPYVAPEEGADTTFIPVQPLQPVTVKGEIRDGEGALDGDFNGTLTISVYDAPRVADNNHSRGPDDLRVVQLDDKLLYEAKMTVTGGKYEGTLRLPVPDFSGRCNTVSLHALSDDMKNSAVGSVIGLQLSREFDPETVATASAPEITAMYLDSPDIPEGSTFTADATLYATVAPDAFGLLGASDRIGGAFSLVLDGHVRLSEANSRFSVGADGSGSLAYPLSGLTDGRHTLTMHVLNVAGLSAERSISFDVANVATATLALEGAIARDEAVFNLGHNLSAEPAGRLVIASSDGTTVFSDPDAVFPYTWNLKDNDGADLPDGRYTATLYFFASPSYGSTAPLHFTIAR